MSANRDHNSNITYETIWSGFAEASAKEPQRVAVWTDGEAVTYGELYQQALSAAAWLHEQKLSGERVGLRMANGSEFLAAFYGVIRARAVAVPLPSDIPHDQLAEWSDHLGLSAVLAKLPERSESAGTEGQAGTDGLAEKRDFPNELPDARIPDEPLSDEPLSDDSLPDHSLPDLPLPEELFYMAISSGSTGKPKGILRTHDSWVESFRQMKQAFGTGSPEERMLVPGPLHYSASLFAALQVLHAGGGVVLMKQYRTQAVRQALLHEGVTAAFMVPAMYAKLLEHPLPVCDRAITFIACGDTFPLRVKQEWLRHFPCCRLYEYYGAAELGFVTCLQIDGEQAPLDSVGRAFPGVEVSIRDERGNRLGPGQIGDVYVSSKMVAQAYGHQGAAAFLQPTDGAYSAGDRGYLDEAGFLHLTGRVQDLIVRGGVNLYPAEIEQALLKLPFVKAAAAFGVPHDVLGEQVIAAVVLQSGQTVWEADQKQQAEARFGRSRGPDAYWLLSELPHNASGKTDRKRLKQEFIRSSFLEKEKNR